MAPAVVVSCRADLDLRGEEVGVGVDDGRADVAVDVEHDELRVRSSGVVLSVRVLVHHDAWNPRYLASDSAGDEEPVAHERPVT